MNVQIMIVGVGGQGIISLGRMLLNAGLRSDWKVRGTETHGLSQRGGAVQFHIRIGGYFAPVIPPGEADILLAMEPIEALRNLQFLKPGGKVIISNTPEIPNSVYLTGEVYPDIEAVVSEINSITDDVSIVNITEFNKQFSNGTVSNLAILGRLIFETKIFDKELMMNLISTKWPKHQESNLLAFSIGYNIVKTSNMI